MNIDPFALVTNAVLGERVDDDVRRLVDPPHRRLLDALSSGSGVPGPRDLAALVRQVLRYESEVQGVVQQLRVPRVGWPDEPMWNEASCVVEHASTDHFVVSAKRWRPSWVIDGTTVGAAAEGQILRRPDLRVPADPFLADALGPSFGHYSSEGQKQAIRTVLSSVPGATLLVNLPTGSGKSAVMLAPALLRSRPTGVSVIVVPTTSLALDQERAAQSHLAKTGQPSPTRLAYFTDLPASERTAIKSAIRSGTQRLVFTSPESLVQSLAPSLYDAARAGHLRFFALDEAHTVASWGVDFRPEFQALSGFRRDLLREASGAGHSLFTTLLLSATLTEEAVNTLVTLFGDPGPLEVVQSVFIRPEPEYWVWPVASEEQRLDRVIETVRNAPRPAIVYVTRRSHANEIAVALRADGHRRTAVVTGKTDADERLEVINNWRGDAEHGGGATVDIVIGTSAFGLGVDQADVRTVLHAALPESIDRYYQEVGRGGRDGRSSLALLVHAPSDRAVAQRLSATRVIGTELGLERWASMMHTAEHLPENRLLISLDSRRGGIIRGSAENEAWNLRTISLMMRAGMLRLDSQRPPELPEGTSEADAKATFEKYFTSAVVEIMDPRHLDEERWVELVGPARRSTISSARRAHETMVEASRSLRDIADLLSAAYEISDSTPLGPRGSTTAQKSCGGCDYCRRHGRQTYANRPSSPEGVQVPHAALSEQLSGLIGPTGSPLLVTFDSANLRERKRKRDFEDVVEALVKHGIRMVCGPPSVLEEPVVQTAHRLVRDGYLFLEPDPLTIFAPRVPTLLVADQPFTGAVLPHRYFATPSRPHPRIVLAPAGSRDPERPDREAVELRHPNIELETRLSLL